MLRSTFTPQSTGMLTWTFDLDFDRTGSEYVYELWMQLGDSALLDDNSFQDGVAVSLRWGNDNKPGLHHSRMFWL